MARLTTAGGIAAGGAGTLVVRQQFDQQGDNSLLRPSVLYGLGVGALGLGSWMAVNRGIISAPVVDRRMFNGFAYNAGVAGLLTGLASAVLPKGASGPQLPAV